VRDLGSVRSCGRGTARCGHGGGAASPRAGRQRRVPRPAGPRRARPQPAGHPRPVARRARPHAEPRRALLDLVQRRDLQLPRAATRAARPPVPVRDGHRGGAGRLRALGSRRAWTASSACSRCSSGTSRKAACFAARDRFGVKPLVYAPLAGGGLALASEARALHAAGVPAVHDETAWATYLTTGLHDHGERTFWAGVRALRPGHWLSWARRARDRRRVYDLADRVGPELDARPTRRSPRTASAARGGRRPALPLRRAGRHQPERRPGLLPASSASRTGSPAGAGSRRTRSSLATAATTSCRGCAR
jgi:hypothetical protein